MRVFHRYGLGLLGILGLLAAWQVAGQLAGPDLLAPPSDVLRALPEMVVNGDAVGQLAVSLAQMGVGYLLALALGVPLGVLMARSRVVDAILHPWVSMMLVTSIAALVPLLVLSFGYDFSFRVAVVLLASVWYILLTVYQAARGLDLRYMDVARSFTASRRQSFFKVIVPALFPEILVAARIGLAHAIRAMITAELFISHGFGRLLFEAGLDVSTAPGLSLLVLLMAVSLSADLLMQALGRWLAPWSAQRTVSGRG